MSALMHTKGQSKIDGYSTGQFSRGEKQEQLLNFSPKDENKQ